MFYEHFSENVGTNYNKSFLRDIWFYTTSEQLSELIGGDVSWYDGQYNVSGTDDIRILEMIIIERLAKKQIDSEKGFGNVETNTAWRQALLAASYVRFSRHDEDWSKRFMHCMKRL